MATMTLPPDHASPYSDDLLWIAAKDGDRDAFADIVSRYQSLVCSVAYAGLGNLAASQDLAQETFVAAWRQLGQLHDPAKLRAWLCGIARTQIANLRRKDARRGGAPASIDDVLEPATPEDDALTSAVKREEEALLWRTIGALPETYREPLILFYREEQSVAQVAELLDLTEETVRQRLSRARALLRTSMTAVVEQALTRSRPTGAFTAGVLAAISIAAPATSAAALTSVTAATASSAKGAAGLSGAVVLGPAAGLATAWLASKMMRMGARSAAEQVAIGRHFRQGVTFALAMVVGQLAGIFVSLNYFGDSPWVLIALTCGWTALLLARLGFVHNDLQNDIMRIRVETGTTDADYAPHLAARGVAVAGPRRYASRWRFLGLPLFSFASGGLDVGSYETRGARGWIAVGDVAISPLLAIGGLAVAPVAIGGATLGVLSLSIGGIALGVLAFGSIAAGWWAFGMIALGWKAAAGATAIARDYAIGGSTRAAEAGTAVALEWFKSQWFTTVAAIFGAFVPWLILLAIVIPIGLLARRAWQVRRATTAVPSSTPEGTRLHALDALRAVALLLGLVLHSALPYIVPPGIWAVGTTTMTPFLGWLVYYLHSFRLPVFFLLAGFFGALVVRKRGIGSWLRDRAVRVLLFFLVALYPMKVLISACWIAGGRATGWLVLPPEINALPLWVLSLGAPFQGQWPAIGLTHLWFLYYLSIISGLFALARWVSLKAGIAEAIASASSRVVRAVCSSPAAPLLVAMVTTPLLSLMTGMDVDTPDRTFTWHLPVLGVYGLFFLAGWCLQWERDLLTTLARRWKVFLQLGLVTSFVAVIGVGMRYEAGPWAVANADALRWATSFGTSVSMAASVLGWMGLFLARSDRPSRSWRYLADASYWMYVAHLPVMVGLQVWWSHSGLPWWIQVPLVNAATIGITLGTYHLLVRHTWLGAWMNGRRAT